MRVVLMGPPGAGKGTQAKRLAETFDMAHLSSGDILRAERRSGSELGRKLKSYMDAGELVPDAIVVEIMARAISAQPGEQGLLLDGFPRTVAQADALDEQLVSLGRPLEAVLLIDVPDEVIVERITGRRSCPECGRVYHEKYLPPAKKGVCDACGVHRAQTAPVIEHYRSHRRPVIAIDGDAGPDEVTRRAVEALRAHGRSARGKHGRGD